MSVRSLMTFVDLSWSRRRRCPKEASTPLLSATTSYTTLSTFLDKHAPLTYDDCRCAPGLDKYKDVQLPTADPLLDVGAFVVHRLSVQQSDANEAEWIATVDVSHGRSTKERSSHLSRRTADQQRHFVYD